MECNEEIEKYKEVTLEELLALKDKALWSGDTEDDKYQIYHVLPDYEPIKIKKSIVLEYLEKKDKYKGESEDVMTNGEKFKEVFQISQADKGKLVAEISKDWWNAEYKEPTNTIDYRRAFKIACDLLNGDILYGVDTDKIYELMMKRDGVISSRSYEEYILNHLQELDQGQYANGSGD